MTDHNGPTDDYEVYQNGEHLRVRPTREGRDGDTQPMPVGNGRPVIHHLVKQDLDARLALGIARYGEPLQPFNGRDPLQDTYEELLDACCYMRQALYERKHQNDPDFEGDAEAYEWWKGQQ